MITTTEYLQSVLKNSQIYLNKKWYYKLFAILTAQIEPKESYDIGYKNKTLYTVIDGVEHQFTDYKTDTPLFKPSTPITVDKTLFPYLKQPVETTVGRLLFNKLVIYDTIKDKLGYINNHISVSKLEDLIANKLKNNDEAREGDIRVDEMIALIDRLNFLSHLSPVINIAATKKTITAPPGIKEIKQKLYEEYKDALNDPVKVVEFQKKLEKIDSDYLSDDPAARNIFNKKSKLARSKFYLMFGSTMDFTKQSSDKPILKSLDEGIDTNPENFPKYINDLRLGSFSRGAFTQLSGYSYKILQRSLSNLKIVKTPCNTTRGIKRTITENNYSSLIFRYVKSDSKWVLIDTKDKAKLYVGKDVIIRSSMYCTSPGVSLCYQCVSDIYKELENGTTNIASQLSHTLMTMFLKLMHGTETQTTNIQLNNLV